MRSLLVTSLVVLAVCSHLSDASWSQWGKCSVTCGDGKRTRQRTCELNELGCIAGKKVKESKDCSSKPCGGLSCYIGMTSTTNNFDVVNNFAITKCNKAPLTPRTKHRDGRTGLQCAITTIQISQGGYTVDIMHGACLTDDMCESLTCDSYSKMLGRYNIQSCDIKCCKKDNCNNPKNFKPTPATPSSDPCATNPCKNGGSCFPVSGAGAGYTCACKLGFQGKDCEAGTTRICYTGVSLRGKLKPSGSRMLPTSCAAADDSCMVATVAAYENAKTIYVDTAQCVKPAVCEALSCQDLKRTMPKFDIRSCRIACCNEDECNQASMDLPKVTTTPYPKATARPKPKPKATKKPPKKPKTTKKPKVTRKPKTPKPTDPYTGQSTEAQKTPKPTGIHWSEWQSWQVCTHRCGPHGTRQRFRFCVNGGPGQPGCTPQEDMIGKEPCNTDQSCVRWRQWNSWQSCSRSCGGGTQERRRSCDGGAPGTGGCDGKDIETQNCNQQSCETTTASTTTRTTTTTTPQTQPQQRRPRWGQYGDWGACSATCGKGMRLRSRQCIGGKVGRRGCRGPKVEKQDCNERQCVEVTTTKATTSPAKPSTPRWGEWEEWEPCSATCGAGTTKRTRTCIGAKRRRRCRGLKVQKNSCAVKACEVTDTDARTSEVKCLDRNVRLARRKGRRCPAVCGGDGECDNGKKCVCDGICGKTCQDTSKSCRNILASIPDGTTISCSSGVSVGSKCTYSCKDGYNLEGEASTFCQGTTKWTNEKNMPMCKGAEADTGTTTGQSCKFKLPVHNSCCGKSSYNSKKARCCDGKTKPAGPKMSKCCGKTPYDPNKKGCCNKKLFAKSNRKCEGGKIVKN